MKNDSEDHQGHADGRGRQVAPCPGGCGSGSRPYTERFNAVVSGLGPRFCGGQPTAPRFCCAAPVRTTCICWSSMTAERGLCGGFNSSIAKLARQHAQDACWQPGKTVKILTVGEEGA